MTQKDFKRKFKKFILRMKRKLNVVHLDTRVIVFKLNESHQLEFRFKIKDMFVDLENYIDFRIPHAEGKLVIDYSPSDTREYDNFYNNLFKIINTNKKREILMNELFIDMLC
jgi:hypothetical protein